MIKEYHRRVLDQVATYLQVLAREQGEFASSLAWMKLRTQLDLAPHYNERRNGLGKDVPNFCLKVPTGGGKTLQATQVLGLIYETILKERNGAGLALWVVPGDQIYKQTLGALRDRTHFYRVSLEHATRRPVEIWEKQEINRITPAQIQSRLNILLLILQSANRVDPETLKMFRDSGGNIVQHFPAEDDEEAHRRLLQKFPDLETVEGTHLVRTSVGNLLRIHEPPVILDEGHRAYSELAQLTINGLNPSIIVELSATPKDQSNVLCRVSGRELLDEEMIKLPINVAAANLANWRDCLDRAKEKRDELERLAAEGFPKTERFIRPIALIQVERTGKDQRVPKFVHSEDVKEQLIQKCGVPENQIAIKTSSRDDIEGIDLLDPECPIRYIVTKSALQEGWDCAFAYVLVSLNNVQSRQSMTQLVGRILRQPDQTRTEIEALNQSYVYCLYKSAETIAAEVKRSLEREGYEDADSFVRSASDDKVVQVRTTQIRREFRSLYQSFKGRIYVPRFCVRVGHGKRAMLEPLNYYRHLLSAVVLKGPRPGDVTWEVDLKQAEEFFYQAHLGEELKLVGQRLTLLPEPDDAVRSWFISNLGVDFFSQKQARHLVDNYLNALFAAKPDLKGKLAFARHTVRDKLREYVEVETDKQTQAEFQRLFDARRLGFYMDCVECRFQLPKSVDVKVVKRLNREDGEHLAKSLLEYEDVSRFNEYEKKVALYLDEHPQILWWYRNLVGREHFAIQGYQRSRIYPDFIAGAVNTPLPIVHVIEAKGGHLSGNPSTVYKEEVGRYFEKLGKAVLWKELGEGFDGELFRFQVIDEGKYEHNWRQQLDKLLGADRP